LARKARARSKQSADHSAKHKKGAGSQPTRYSAHLRAKESALYEDMSSKASKLKSLKNELAYCSKDLKMKGRGLRKRKLTAADLIALAGTIDLPAAAAADLDQMLVSDEC
jgi:hypothetical protein